MSFKDWHDLISENWKLLAAVVVVVGPIMWLLASLFYSERIESLREQINLIKMQKEFVESKLRAIEEIKIKVSGQNGEQLNISATDISSLKYPRVSNPEKLSRDDIKRLADYYDLTKAWKYNPHLKMQDGDIAYWFEQGMSEDEIKLQFESRRLVLQEADKNQQVIDSQGDLSALAQKIQAKLIKTQVSSGAGRKR